METEDRDGSGMYEVNVVVMAGDRNVVVTGPMFHAVDREAAEIKASKFSVDIY